jgi:hypothetical protein
MNRISTMPSRPRGPRDRCGRGFALLIAAVAGCGPSAEVNELPDAAKKTLIQKKVDVQPRTSTPKPKRP